MWGSGWHDKSLASFPSSSSIPRPLPRLPWPSLQALILDFIHYVDVCDQLIQARVASASEWAWRRQLRYYPQGGDGRVAVAMAEAQFEYTWEYQVRMSDSVREWVGRRWFGAIPRCAGPN